MTMRHGLVGMAGSIHRVLALLVALVMAAGLLTAASGGSAAAQSTTYGFWAEDGCYQSWGGTSQGFQRTSTCDDRSYMGWDEVEGYDALFHWDGTAWQMQGILLPTADGNYAFAVPFSDGTNFFYLYSNSSWYHVDTDADGDLFVEGPSGWVNITEQSVATAESDFWAFYSETIIAASDARGVNLMLQPACATSIEGCD